MQAIEVPIQISPPPHPATRTPRSFRVYQLQRSSPLDTLTYREKETLHLLAQGLTNRQIAALLHIAPSTAKGHVERLLAKLDAPNRTQAASKAFRLGLMADVFHTEQ